MRPAGVLVISLGTFSDKPLYADHEPNRTARPRSRVPVEGQHAGHYGAGTGP
ncbi:hypothetical protein EMIT0180MI3_360041 [Priestia megaterium]